ncbi:MAG: hypothetical protein GTN62_03050 [Gemmatimonadales bacterium]|nr:hypothetical protein [Gemmatimonadales bacterium]NIN49077.1 hypothetical protein [Gemmatimonadales bacterium]NIP06541.1 hypothetical protein [Gemmatimonadales bacterium]NIR00238.1 hypothetical protein [Gemmatimonadales bacterium]NIS64571.1 hypothetical protein [Gemmatimonadales bacterium]
MRIEGNLLLHEEIMLLALRDKEGTIATGAYYAQAIGGAILAELLLNGRIKVEEEKKKKFAALVSAAPMGDPVIDECLEKIKTAKRQATLRTWVGRFAQLKQLKHRVAESLCRRGILKADEDKVLLIFTRKIYPELDPRPERDLVRRLKQAIFTYSRELDPRTVVLISLANASGILKTVFDKSRLKDRKKRLQRIMDGHVVGEATKEAVEAMQAAVMVATVVPAVVMTTSAGR